MDRKRERIDYLVETLNRASDAYYGGEEEIMSNFEWDALFDELGALEVETGYVRDDSPTQRTSDSDTADEAEEEPHEYPALSLAKTKKIDELAEWAGDRPIWVSWKLDGITLVATYDNGELVKILSRGNGVVGKRLNHLIGAILGMPVSIAYTGHLVVRGEATISYPDFDRINDTLPDGAPVYANPRNLVSGTISLDAENLDVVRERRVTFNAFTLVHLDEPLRSWGERLALLDSLGFTTVEREAASADTLPDVISRWTERVDSGDMKIPVDGLVINYDDTDYAATGSVTGHHATRAGLAFKWEDVSAKTMLDHIEWSCASSTITPVAVFDPVQLEGTTVSRASMCNISELMRLGIGDNGKTELEVIKANKIIPKVIRVVRKEGDFTVPAECPVCGAPTEKRLNEKSNTVTLHCTNPECPAKQLKRFTRFVSKAGMDIDGLSIETLKDFVNMGFIKDFADIYTLNAHREEIVNMEGMGVRSCDKLLAAIETSRSTTLPKLLHALCIPNIGGDTASKIIRAIGTQSFYKRVESGEGFTDVDGIGTEKSNSIVEWFSAPENRSVYDRLLEILTIADEEPVNNADGACAGLTFVITGSVNHFPNRGAFKAYVQSEGGSVADSVSSKTNYLVNNDIESTSGKNKKAKSLNIPIISEDEFLERFGDKSH